MRKVWVYIDAVLWWVRFSTAALLFSAFLINFLFSPYMRMVH